MLSHERVWTAIDRLAQRYNLSASGLARKAGLDATSFNRSKRVSPEGRQRWPSTESVAKVLAATGATLDEFIRLVEPPDGAGRTTIPLIGTAQAASGEPFTPDGLPVAGPGWRRWSSRISPSRRCSGWRWTGTRWNRSIGTATC